MNKRELLLDLLRRSQAFVQLDGRKDGVVLPEWLRGDPHVVLQLGYDLAVPIPDLVVDDLGFRCTLSFRRTPTFIDVPWAAVYAIADAEGHQAVFPEDVPTDLVTSARAAGPEKEPEKPEPPPKKPRPSHLKLVK